MTTKKHKPALLSFLTNRRTVQTASLLFSNAYFLSFMRFIPCGYLQCSNCALSTFACPLILLQRGAVMASMGMLGSVDSKFAASILAALAVLVFFGAAFGSFACGWLCPFGFIQDLFHKLPGKKFTLPGWTGHLRLPVFAGLVIVVPYLTRTMFFCDVCPSGTINRLWQQALEIPLFFKTPQGGWAVFSLVFLFLLVMAAIFINRPFCSLFCPIGGFYGIFNKISGLFITVNQEKCVDCGRCLEACPQGINPAQTTAHSQCSRCLQCSFVNCKFISAEIRI